MDMYNVVTGSLIILTSIIVLVAGVWVLSSNVRSRINLSFFGITLSLLLWSIANFIFWTCNLDVAGLNFWLNQTFIGPTFAFAFLVYFSYVFPEDKAEVSITKSLLIFLGPVLMSLVTFAEKVSYEVTGLFGEISWGWGFYVFYLFTVTYVLWTILNFYFKIEDQKGPGRSAISYVFLGLILAIIAGAFFNNFIPIAFGSNRFIFLGSSSASLIFVIFCTYAIVRYDLMDIEVIAKQAFLYGVLVAFGSMLFGGVVFVSEFIEGYFPLLSFWFIPTLFSVIGVFLGLYIFNALRISEAMKYEFITTVTHKFRTPLSRIVWAVEGIKEEGNLTDIQKNSLRSIDYSGKSIIKLVDLMIATSNRDTGANKMEKELDLSAVLRKTIDEHRQEFERKEMKMEEDIEDNVPIFAEESSISFIINVLIENALIYTPKYGSVHFSLITDRSEAILQVKDNGIGMDKEMQEHISSSFFRGDKARSKDTEGMGVGLYISKNILDELGGELGFYSEGERKGSTFFFKVPLVRDKGISTKS